MAGKDHFIVQCDMAQKLWSLLLSMFRVHLVTPVTVRSFSLDGGIDLENMADIWCGIIALSTGSRSQLLN